MNELVWVTPDPSKVKRFIALRRNGRWTETYLGERLLVHKSNLYELKMRGFIECGEDLSSYVFKTKEEALACEDKFKLKVK